jgi:hypothetical protein
MTRTRTVRALNRQQQEIRDRPEGNDIGAHSAGSLEFVSIALASGRSKSIESLVFSWRSYCTPHTQSRAPVDHGTLSRKATLASVGIVLGAGTYTRG